MIPMKTVKKFQLWKYTTYDDCHCCSQNQGTPANRLASLDSIFALKELPERVTSALTFCRLSNIEA
jgi:hypothetical protein